MAIAAAGGNLQAVQLNRFVTQVPEKAAASLERKAFAVKTLATITTIAIVAIVGAVLAVSLGLGAMTGTLPFIMLGLAIATPFLAMGATKLRMMAGGMDDSETGWILGGGFKDQAKIERGVAEELAKISQWTGQEVRQFFADRNWPMDQIPMNALALLNRQDPLKALLPLIARYNFCCRVSDTLQQEFREARDQRYNDPHFGHGARNYMNLVREQTAIPFALDAAVFSQVLRNPTLPIQSHTALVRVDARPLDLREMARRYDQNDTYLLFKDPADPEKFDENRPPISLTELELDLTPEGLRQKLFLPAVRV